MITRRVYWVLLIAVWLSAGVWSVKALEEPNYFTFNSVTKVTNERELVNRSTMIILGTPSGVPSMSPVQGSKLPEGQLMRYQQDIQVEKVLKGSAVTKVRLSRLGIEPLPPIEDPINKQYPGPLAEDVHYILFLEKEATSNLYAVVGIWQGVYPLNYQGKTIALQGEGFSSLEGLTVAEMQEKINHFAR